MLLVSRYLLSHPVLCTGKLTNANRSANPATNIKPSPKTSKLLFSFMFKMIQARSLKISGSINNDAGVNNGYCVHDPRGTAREATCNI